MPAVIELAHFERRVHMKHEASATTFQLIGAALFGAVIGWFLYYVNRYRKEVAIGDLATVIAAIGAGAILTLFPAKSDLFAAYAIGLASGFFTYFLILLFFVIRSKLVSTDLFLGILPPGMTREDIGRVMGEPDERINK